MADTQNNTLSSGSTGAPETFTDSTADSLPAVRFDFVDSTLIIGSATLFDFFLGVFPVIGEVGSPLVIGAFKILFWLKGVKNPVANWMMGVTGISELIPVFSEILPGCTAYVLTVILTQNFAQVTDVARTVAKVAPDPETKAIAAGVAAAGDVVQGQDAKTAISQEAAGAFSGGAGQAAGVGTGTAGASTGTQSAGGATTVSGTGGNDFRGNFDFGSIGAQAEEASQGRGRQNKESENLAGDGKTPYAQGSPLEMTPVSAQSEDQGAAVNRTFVERRRRQLEEEQEEKRRRNAA